MCQPLFLDLSKVEERIRAASRISLFLDFDGTLAPLGDHPANARLAGQTREAINRIVRLDRVVTTIISGRALADISSRIGLDNIIYAGNHGLEICGRKLHFTEPTAAERRPELQEISSQVTESLRSMPCAVVEHKGLTTTVHYRGATSREVTRIQDAVRAIVAPAASSFRVSMGKMAFEIVPRTGWHKGTAVRWINRCLNQEDLLSTYLGDDRSDEDAFRALPDGITIKVGDFTLTAARYHLADPPEVQKFLVWLANHVSA